MFFLLTSSDFVTRKKFSTYIFLPVFTFFWQSLKTSSYCLFYRLTFCSLVVYVYFPHLYHDDTKRKPKLDFALTALVSMFWLVGSAAWANGLTGLRWSVDSNNWLHKTSICRLTNNNHYVDTKVKWNNFFGSQMKDKAKVRLFYSGAMALILSR